VAVVVAVLVAVVVAVVAALAKFVMLLDAPVLTKMPYSLIVV
jgi:hypothetical protein